MCGALADGSAARNLWTAGTGQDWPTPNGAASTPAPAPTIASRAAAPAPTVPTSPMAAQSGLSDTAFAQPAGADLRINKSPGSLLGGQSSGSGLNVPT